MPNNEICKVQTRILKILIAADGVSVWDAQAILYTSKQQSFIHNTEQHLRVNWLTSISSGNFEFIEILRQQGTTTETLTYPPPEKTNLTDWYVGATKFFHLSRRLTWECCRMFGMKLIIILTCAESTRHTLKSDKWQSKLLLLLLYALHYCVQLTSF
jgi:hypothetical protein